MFGAVIGDIVGSVYEWNNIKTKEFPLFSKEGSFTDDTILTLATAEWLMEGGTPEKSLRKWALKYDTGEPNKYGKAWFSKKFMTWARDEAMGPYGANTNGCVMRISPVPFLVRDREEAFEKAEVFTNATHNHPDSHRAVKAYIDVIHQTFKNAPVSEIRQMLESDYGYDMSKSVDELREMRTKFDYTCNITVPDAITCALEGKSFEDSIRNAVSLGGDSDTLAAMSGAIAEARFGIPKEIGNKAVEYLDKDALSVLKKMYKNEPKQERSFMRKATRER